MRYSNRQERLARLGARQGGRVTYGQLLTLGFAGNEIVRLVARGWLIRRVPRVYAIGSAHAGRDGLVWEAVLYAGPGACLTGASGSHSLGLTSRRPGVVFVATPRHVSSCPGIRVLAKRRYDRVLRGNDPPVAPLPDLMLDLAAMDEFDAVRRALSVLDFRSKLDRRELLASCRSGRRGSVELRRALATHQPELAHTRSELEVAFLLWLEAEGLPIPKFNRCRNGVTPDAIWDELKLAVELDGRGNHHSAAQLARDAENQRALEAGGWTVLRFTWDDLHRRPSEVRAALAAHGLR